MILHFLDSSSMGGIEAHVETLARAQQAAGEDVALLLWRLYPHATSQARFRMSGLRLMSANGSFPTLCRILKRARVSTLHTHGYKANILGRVAAQLSGVQAVSTFHAGERAPFPVSAYQTLDEWTSFLAKRIAVSRPIADAMPFKTRFISNFVEVPPLRQNSANPRNISFAGRLSPEKGPDLFCKIAARLDGELTFSAYGEGPMLEELRQSCDGKVAFMGFAPDMEAVWRRTGLLLMPSRNEGLPMAALEAMARGIPVAAAATGALPDVISHGVDGFLFPVGDVETAARCLRSWFGMTDDEKSAMSCAARNTILNRYSTVRGLREVFDVYGRPAAASMTSNVQSSSGR